MTLVYGNRGCGKTKRLIKWSAKTGGWIFVATIEGKHYIEYMIRNMGLTGKAHVFSKSDAINPISTNKPPKGTKVSIDEFQNLLEEMLPNYEIEEITFSGDMKRLRGGIKENL